MRLSIIQKFVQCFGNLETIREDVTFSSKLVLLLSQLCEMNFWYLIVLIITAACDDVQNKGGIAIKMTISIAFIDWQTIWVHNSKF